MDLIYLGAGIDNRFLDLEDFEEYDTVYCYDIMPSKKYYYNMNEQIDPEKFIETLFNVYGEPVDAGSNHYTFECEGRTIEYYINCDIDSLMELPEGDIYLSGYIPNNRDLMKDRMIYVDYNYMVPEDMEENDDYTLEYIVCPDCDMHPCEQEEGCIPL
jgi:hypothetical protein